MWVEAQLFVFAEASWPRHAIATVGIPMHKEGDLKMPRKEGR